MKYEFGQPLEGETERNVVYGIIFDHNSQKYGYIFWKDFDNSPALVGGGIEDGEDIEEGLLREINEETGYNKIEKLIPLNAEINTHYYSQARQRNIFSHALAYLIIVNGLPTGNNAKESHEEKSEFKWDDPHKILEFADKTSFSRPFIDMVSTYLKLGVMKSIEEKYDTTNNMNNFKINN